MTSPGLWLFHLKYFINLGCYLLHVQKQSRHSGQCLNCRATWILAGAIWVFWVNQSRKTDSDGLLWNEFVLYKNVMRNTFLVIFCNVCSEAMKFGSCRSVSCSLQMSHTGKWQFVTSSLLQIILRKIFE